jgi:hypothetical protein
MTLKEKGRRMKEKGLKAGKLEGWKAGMLDTGCSMPDFGFRNELEGRKISSHLISFRAFPLPGLQAFQLLCLFFDQIGRFSGRRLG